MLPKLQNGRVVNVSSIAHYFAKAIDIEYLTSKWKTNYDVFQPYALSKLAQIQHASELTRRYGIKAYAVHPGTISSTNLKTRQTLLSQLIINSLFFVCKTVEQGAMTPLYCALSDDAKPGYYYSNCQVTKPSDLALDTRRAEKCWNESEKLINEKLQ